MRSEVYSLNPRGREYLDEFRRTWSFTERLEQLRERGEQTWPQGRASRSSATADTWRRSPGRSRTSGAIGHARRASSGFPTTSHTATDALRRYLRFLGPPDKADSLLSTLEDLAALFEQSATNGTPDPRSRRAGPVEFTEAFLTNHPQGQEHHRSRHKRQVVTKQRTDI
ncbi:hypothetical protein [Nonomuraea dietziae]|uniref:Uncharacterized protein n=1 Tax=Nonomuraea dietziae TaxID=65515 RepID=A0A7W5VF60_9ACTN|nr:hypothetical protein [Nonomuraea dietziae]MBB3732545.1 hypothetical protein [Nonomuraea dietziae]